MTRIIKAESLGFCMGVRRAIDKILNEADKHGEIETLGALVHNQQVIDHLSEKGVHTVNDPEEIKGSRIVISAHGVGPQVIDALKNSGLEVVDTTCSFVKRAQKAAAKLNQDGFFTLVFGDKKHPEVKGILGWAEGNGLATIHADDLKELPAIPKKLGIVSQTTQIPAAFDAFVKEVFSIAFRQDSEIRIVDTFCHDIRRRQEVTSNMAKECELVYVIGGKNSANTRHLYDICSAHAKTYQIETADDILPTVLEGVETIGVAAGASTEDQTIDEVIKRLEELTHAVIE
jgi:4-hydroxy-3-methylbut-2-enyl diphosphate reductase